MIRLYTFFRIHYTMSQVKHVSWALLDQCLVSGSNFLTSILLARFLGLKEFGVYTLAWMGVLFLSGLQQALIIAPMMSIGSKQADGAEAYFSAVFIQQFIWSILSFIMVLFVLWISNTYMQQDILHLALPLAAAALAFQMQDFFRRYFFTRNLPQLAFINDVVSYGGQLVTLMAFNHMATITNSQALWIVAGTSLVAALLGASQIRTLHLPPLPYSIDTLKRHWLFSKWLVASSFLQWASGNFLILFSAACLDARAAGIIRAAQNIMGITHILFQALENIVPIRASRTLTDLGIIALNGYLLKIGVLSTGLTTAFSIAIGISPDYWMRLFYGAEYIDYSYILWWYIPIYITMSLVLPVRAGLRAIEHTKPIFSSYLLTTAFSMLFALPLIKILGIAGAVLGTGITQGLVLGVLYTAYRNHFKRFSNQTTLIGNKR